MAHYGTAREDFDHVRAADSDITDPFADFGRSVGLAICKGARQGNLRRQTGNRTGSAGHGDESTWHQESRSNDVPTRDRITHGDIDKGPVGAGFPTSREA